jgi:SAM-dependent MidA family methyltransferase
MVDILRVRFSHCHRELADSPVHQVISHLKRAEIKQVHLVETSAPMRSVQEDALSASAQKLGCALTWHDSLESVPHDPTLYTMFIAHEFFDALPIHIVEVSFFLTLRECWHLFSCRGRPVAGKKS